MNIDTGKGFDEAMEWAIQLWCFERPDEVADFNAFIKFQRDQGKDDNFWSEGRQFKHVGECPAFVHARIAERTQDFNWFHNKGMRDRFFSRFAQFRMDPTYFGGTTTSSRAQG